MSQIKAFQILSSLNEEEFEKFHKFLQSPYFNRSKDILRFFNSVRKYYPMFSNPKLDNKILYKKIYPGKIYNEGTIRNLFSELGSLSEKFLGYVVYEESFLFKYNIVSELNDRSFDKLFVKTHKKFTDELDKSINETDQKNLYSFLLDNEMEMHNIRMNKGETIASRDYGAESLFTYFIGNFFIKDINWNARYYNSNTIADYNIVKDFFEKTDIGGIIANMKANNVVDADKIEIEYFLYRALQNGENCYEKLVHILSLIRVLRAETATEQIVNYYVSVLNVLNHHMKSDDKLLKILSFEIKKEMVEKNLTTERRGRMKQIEFITILDAALNVQELEWAKNFLENKIKVVEEALQPDLYNFYKAKILFAENKFNESNEFLSKVKNESFFLRMDVKTLKMRNYYELGFIEAGFSAAEALQQFLLRTDILSPKRKEGFTNFLKFYKALLKKKADADEDIDYLKKEISECKIVRNKIWLTEKVNNAGNYFMKFRKTLN